MGCAPSHLSKVERIDTTKERPFSAAVRQERYAVDAEKTLSVAEASNSRQAHSATVPRQSTTILREIWH